MSILSVERASDSPLVETITHGQTVADGSTVRPAESHWHMVLVKPEGPPHFFVVGPLSNAGVVSWQAGAEILWIKFKLGAYMPRMPTKSITDSELALPRASGKSFWLDGSAWQLPDFENVDTFLNRLLHQGTLANDPLVATALKQRPEAIPSRTLRHRFRHVTGLSQSHIRQIERAQQAAALLRQGVPILDTVHETGFFDQPHLTRALKQWVGHTPAQILRANPPTG